VLLYNLFLVVYRLGIGISALYNHKAKLWVEGRKNWQQHLEATLKPGEKRIWIHCSSLGEFEQGRPLVELLKRQYPGYKIVITFFSPSGYEACKNYVHADYIFYLPLDSGANAHDFVTAVDPSLVIFVKYEFWHYYLTELKARHIPLLLVSAAFREEQVFFKRYGYGNFFRNMLQCFTHIHVQDVTSAKLLESIGIKNNVSITGDTRYDRVTAIASGIRAIPEIEQFRGGNKILIAGSTWPGDENILHQCLPMLPAGWKMIIAPHEVDTKHIRQVQELFAYDAALFSTLATNPSQYDKRILIIDNIGMLSSLYAYGDIAWVGGGFQKGGIHNVLEPAIFGLPVVIGPVYQKFVEAVKLVSVGAVFPIEDAASARAILANLVNDAQQRQQIHTALRQFMTDNTGAAQHIADQVKASISL